MSSRRAGEPVQIDATPAARALAAVALDGLATRTGGQLATSQEYQKRIGIGSGTVRKAIRELDERGALSIRSRGHLGTVVTGRDPGLLWQLAGRQQLRIAVTPPGAPDQQGLTRGLMEQCDELGVPHSQHYLRGARHRINKLLQGDCDLIALSAEAAAGMTTAQKRRIAVLPLPRASYYDIELLVLVSRSGAATAQRVGIDRDSRDHTALTEIAFAERPVELVECPFSLIPRSVLTGEIDGGLWHRQFTLIPPELAGLMVEPLPERARAAVPADVLVATLAWRKADVGLGGLTGDFDLDAIGRVQGTVIREAANGSDDQFWL